MEPKEPKPHTIDSLLSDYHIQEFIEFRQFKEEDFHFLVELAQIDKNILNRNFHNSFQFWGKHVCEELSRFKKRLETDGLTNSDQLFRATEIYLQIAEKYSEDSYLIVDNLNRVMENLK